MQFQPVCVCSHAKDNIISKSIINIGLLSPSLLSSLLLSPFFCSIYFVRTVYSSGLTEKEHVHYVELALPTILNGETVPLLHGLKFFDTCPYLTLHFSFPFELYSLSTSCDKFSANYYY